MKLIADAGSTKIDWCVISDDGRCHGFTSEGVNALMADDDALNTHFARALNSLGSAPDEVWYYGAGCVDEAVCERVETALRRVLHTRPEAVVEADSDLLGAARALCGHEAGIACILGTGSNTGLYDGCEITDHVPSMGYVLGDEGSGAAIGKALISAIYRRVLTDDLRKEFEAEAGLDYGGILRRIYSQPGANTFLASFVPFVAGHIQHGCVRRLVAEEFRRFFTSTIRAYGSAALDLPIHFTGGVATTFSDILRQSATLCGFNTIEKIEARPMAGLIQYHTQS